jgi:hypothetical protein
VSHSVPSAAGPAQSRFNQASSFLQARAIDLALPLFGEAERLGFDPDQCAGGRWHCHMLRGDFQSAWHESDQIYQRGAPDPNRLWSGRSVQGKRVIVRCLHGLGDAIQFIRYITLLRRQASRVYVEVPQCLVRLFRCLKDVDAVITWDAPGPELLAWDEQVEVMEFPWLYRTTIASIPCSVPYIIPHAPKADGWDARALRIGFAWAASSWNPLRSIPLDLLRPLLSDSRSASYSLHLDENCRELASIPFDLRPRQVLTGNDDVLSTAELVASMDLVITVDTMIAHLAGALGKPVWLLLAYPGDWRWMMDRDDSPWYPTMRIFRQKEDRDWTPAVRDVQQALASFERPTDMFYMPAEEAS